MNYTKSAMIHSTYVMLAIAALACGPDITEPVALQLPLTGIAAAGGHTCAVAQSKSYCWGGNLSGELGNGTRRPSFYPVEVKAPVPLTVISNFGFVGLPEYGDEPYARYPYTCGLDDQGNPYCWGDPFAAQLASYPGCAECPWPHPTKPERIPGGPYVQLSASFGHACGLTRT